MTKRQSPNQDTPTASATSSPQVTGTYDLDRGICEFDSFAFKPEENKYHASYDGDVEATTAVLSAVAAVAKTDPLDMEPLHTTIDPDALERIVSGDAKANGRPQITFDLQGWQVTVNSTCTLALEPSRTQEQIAASDD